MRKKQSLKSFFLVFLCVCMVQASMGQDIPLPEHPRPDFMRPEWVNLNGVWEFEFDTLNIGITDEWHRPQKVFQESILVPFPWGSPLSGVEDKSDVAWYRKKIIIPPEWSRKRTFLVIGASDWETTVWLDGQLVGSHKGGYVPIEMELTPYVKYGIDQSLVIRVDDIRRDFTLYGKQGYGNARGIWQTVYLEARGRQFLKYVHFTPDIDKGQVAITAAIDRASESEHDFEMSIETPAGIIRKTLKMNAGQSKINFQVKIPDPRLWSLEDPYLYEATIQAGADRISTYFGMRKISVVDLPGTEYPYIALNDKPIYLQMALDQSYHPDGYYTFPSDQFMREEIERSKSIGLNGIRTHIKVEVPRKLYWADKLGLLVMEDLPNSWGEPDELMQEESEYTLRQMIKRDYNHPSIFSWVVFNETWGLYTHVNEDSQTARRYLPSTQAWVASMYYLAKSLDQTRLVEDNSICCGRGHTETDINSWHAYLPGWAWYDHLDEIDSQTYAGSTHHFEEGYRQDRQPNINSECGNVWGYEGSTGDVDWSWDYHRMINTFRMFPKVAGWLYTEHHDVINEWNGYWRFDRSDKETGLEAFVEGMSLKDLHAETYLTTGNEIMKTVSPSEMVEIPLFLSDFSGNAYGSSLTLLYEVKVIDASGAEHMIQTGNKDIPFTPWAQLELDPLMIKAPQYNGIAHIGMKLTDVQGTIIHRNFFLLEIAGGDAPSQTVIYPVAVKDYTDAMWSQKLWDVMEGKKVNGAGKGYFEYTFRIPRNESLGDVEETYIVLEASAKELFVKDRETFDTNQDYMRGSRVFPSSNPNAYPMTDETKFPSEVRIFLNGRERSRLTLEDDPADHRGVLSWHYQLRDRKLREAGSYGYLVKIPLSRRDLRRARSRNGLTVRLETIAGGGIAIYGKSFGRYPFDPSLVIIKNKGPKSSGF